MDRLEITLDASLIVAAYNKGMEDMFMIMQEFHELESNLNCNGIVTKSNEESE